MSKKTRAEKREEERRMIAEMEEALQERAESENAQATPQRGAAPTPRPAPTPKPQKGKKGFHCPRCKTLLQEDGKCPTCEYKMYIPMDEKKRNKIRLIVAAVCMVVFVVLFIILQFKK